MNKCPKCGTQYEGQWCPECGEKWQEKKVCPKCGNSLYGSAKFCPNCGYSFAAPTAKPSALSKAKSWVKTHKKPAALLAILLVIALVLAIALPVGLANRYNGTYYLYEYEEYVQDKYFTLKGGKWENQLGEKGEYKVSGENITLYQTVFGENTAISGGTIKKGVMTLSVFGVEMVYAKKGAMHEHKFGEWEVEIPSTCIEAGTEIRRCKCGETETRTMFSEHTLGEWFGDENSHWHICSVCKQQFDLEEHTDSSNKLCEICDIFTSNHTRGMTYEVNRNKTGYIITGLGIAKDSEIIIPSVYDNLPVLEIGFRAFLECRSLTSITIPDSVTSIREHAFADCSSLTSIVIGNGVTSIRSGAFASCSSLTSIEIPDSVTLIGDGTFSGCENLMSVVIPDSLTLIGDAAFAYCSSLTSIVIPDSVTSIGSYAFSGCSSLTSVYYTGTAEDWNEITVVGSNNSSLTSATRYYFSEEEPTAEMWAEEANWWHYGADMVPTPWVKED